MAEYDFKTITPDTSFGDGNLLFGADDQSSATPVPYTSAGLKAWIQGFITDTAHGQCRFEYVSATQVVLKPSGGNRLRINGASYSIPAAGVTAANTSTFINGVSGNLANSTVYNVYAFINGGNIALDFSATARAVDAATSGNFGVQIKTGDATRTLVGKIETNSSGQFVSSLTISWFNRKVRTISSADTADRTSTAIWTEMNTSMRVRFLSWGFEEDVIGVSFKAGLKHATAGTSMYIGVGLDGVVAVVGALQQTEPVTNYTMVVANRYAGAVAEGVHYYTLVGGVTSGTLTMDNSNSANMTLVEFFG